MRVRKSCTCEQVMSARGLILGSMGACVRYGDAFLPVSIEQSVVCRPLRLLNPMFIVPCISLLNLAINPAISHEAC